MKRFSMGLLVAGLGLVGSHATAQDLDKAVKARQAVMQLYAFNLGTLGAMAKGQMDYDAAVAQAAAGNIVKVSSQNQMAYWPQGSAVGEVEGSKALPAVWENMEDVGAKAAALTEAAMQAEAATDLAGLQAAMGAMGGACGACHKSYRQSD
ncbi:c-type cytochrome [Pseudooceanicola onchidii]|uniref:c-type cytochrome n=1 Tax=Pseudooceanicola onchidii TaxID=2562279 RepID=UPI0010AAC6DD|nr:cytochrome c [Pseudooceanicola onchidii]